MCNLLNAAYLCELLKLILVCGWIYVFANMIFFSRYVTINLLFLTYEINGLLQWHRGDWITH